MTTGKRQWVLCGGLASGKSTVRRIIERHGLSTIDSDSIGHEVLEVHGAAHDSVARRWPAVVGEGGRIDRARLAAVVFGDRAELDELESLTHPHIFDTIGATVEQIDGSVVVEIPLLEHGLGAGWSRIVVDAGLSTRFERAVARGTTADDVRARLAAQPSREEWLAAADVVIPNHSSEGELASTVARLIPKL